MNRIVRENYPVAELPEDLREGFASNEVVRVMIEQTMPPAFVKQVPTLDELWALRRPPFKDLEEIVAEVRRDRDEWDD